MSSGRIPSHFLEELLARTDIVDLVEARIRLRKTGSNYVALCPFHQEKTPSFSVSAAKQLFYCFGCHAHGNAISFLMQYDRIEFVDAVETLAAQVGLSIPYEQNEAAHNHTQQTKPLYAVLEQSARYFQNQLAKSPQAIEYLKQRGLTGEICKRFAIGYAPAGHNSLAQYFTHLTQDKESLFAAGMLSRSNTRECYDRFRQRVMFPIRDIRGRVIAFGGRAIHADDQPKYLNSPETLLFHKGQELYGLYEARQANTSLTKVLVVEGYMDVVALAQHGISNVVATLGTALSTRQVQRLIRYTKEIVFCFDGDNAGRQAAWRALEMTLPIMRDGIQALFLFLPEGEDPDSLVRKEGEAAFQQRLQAAIPLSEFFFQQLGGQTDISTLDGRSRLSSLAQPLLQKIPEGIFRELMQQRLAEIIGVATEKLEKLHTTNHPAATLPPAQLKRSVSRLRSPLKMAVMLLLQHPHLAQQCEEGDWLKESNLPGANILCELVSLLKRNPKLTAAGLLENWRDRKESAYLAALTNEEHSVPAEGLLAEFQDIMLHLQEKVLQQTIDNLLKKAKQQALTTDEQSRLKQLLEQRHKNRFSSH